MEARAEEEDEKKGYVYLVPFPALDVEEDAFVLDGHGVWTMRVKRCKSGEGVRGESESEEKKEETKKCNKKKV